MFIVFNKIIEGRMEELYEQISERFDRLHEVVKGQISA